MSFRTLILLGTYNGEAHLAEQLESLEQQTVSQVDVLVSDDGSSDGTLGILSDWEKRWPKGRFQVVSGPGEGFAENFRSLIVGAPRDHDLVAFCDQDDWWHPDKLERAAAALNSSQSAGPKLYCGRTRYVSSERVELGNSPLMARPPSFRNALVQSLAGGNTMALDRRAFALVAKASRNAPFVSHDWWSYALVTGAGGDVIYDPVPSIDYRQHGGNAIGSNTGTQARVRRIRMLFSNRFRDWIDTQTDGLISNADLLSEGNRALLERFAHARTRGGQSLPAFLLRQRFYRQSLLGTISLYAGAAIGKI